ncbi:MFS transporter [Chthonobacter albigriseus]|uniref:MFS transporter n=1 Tax=Chthonobacter albigriseus TaxID=1683161 RepID=UPI0015EF5C7D|nr:MFS transporter [Chthonobacter albigriseus]
MSVSIHRARWAIAAVFFVNGGLLGSWAPQVPLVKERLGLSPADLGLALLVLAIGAVTAMPFSGILSGRFGSSVVTRTAILLQMVLLPFVAVVPSFAILCPLLFAFGAANGVCDVAMNAHGVEVERRYARPILSSLHGMWSVGGFVAASAAAGLLALVTPLSHLLIVIAAAAVILLVALTNLLPADADKGPAEGSFVWPNRVVLAIGGLTALVFLAEGAMLDWAAVYLRDDLLSSPSFAATGYAAFAGGMAIGRFAGDAIRRRVSAVRLVRWSALAAALFLALGVASGSPLVVVAAFGATGLALANMAPVLFGAAGRLPGQSSAAGVAAAATCGYFGFLAGPPVIGFVAEAFSLGAGFVLLSLGCLVVAVAAVAARPADLAPDPDGTVG